jgi:hypothetical protein
MMTKDLTPFSYALLRRAPRAARSALESSSVPYICRRRDTKLRASFTRTLTRQS